jgi:imidazolonepropionase-like amidohydrolase
MYKTIMTIVLIIFIVCLLLLTSMDKPLNAETQETAAPVIHLQGALLIDGTGSRPISNSLVVIKGERIIYAGPAELLPNMPRGKRIDCQGKTILPGLFDAHIHLGASCNLGYIHLENKRKLASFLYAGVTSIFDLAGVSEMMFLLRNQAGKPHHISPRFFTVGPCFTCPKGHGTEYGVPMALTPRTEAEALKMVQDLAIKKPDMIKIIYERGSRHFPSISYRLMKTIIDESHRLGFKVITHITTLQQARDAVKAGSDGLAHTVTDKIMDGPLLQAMKRNRVFCIPTISVFEAFAVLGTEGKLSASLTASPLLPAGVCREILKDITQKKGAVSQTLGMWQKAANISKKNVKKMAEAGIKLVLGTDAGNPLVLFGPAVHRELQLMVEAGVRPMAAIQSATIHAAKVLKRAKDMGSVEAGKLADLLIINGNPLKNISDTQKIALVIKGGRIWKPDHLAKIINPEKDSTPGATPGSRTAGHRKGKASSRFNSEELARIRTAKNALAQGLDGWQAGPMKKARQIFLALSKVKKEKNSLLLYYIGLCNYRLTTFYMVSNRTEAEKLNLEGKQYLEKARVLSSPFPEAEALYASVLGFEIAFHPDRAMQLGLKSMQHMDRALREDPGNPRINLLKGASLIFTPAMFGGGADKALPFLSKSIELFATEMKTDAVLPCWGHAEAFTFLGMAYSQLKETKKAKISFKKALAVNPHYSLAREELKKLSK